MDVILRTTIHLLLIRKKKKIDAALKSIKQDFDIMITIGGGSVIDFAKGFRFYSKNKTKLIAIPTTAGTG